MKNLLKRILSIKQKDKIKAMILVSLMKLDLGVKVSCSQSGEDCIILALFSSLKIEIKDIYYLEIGTNHPYLCNNTFLLYRSGAHGVCVEPNIFFADIIRKLRPGDKLLTVGITDLLDQTEAVYYRYRNHGLNTFDSEEVEHRKALGLEQPEEMVNLPVININSMIQNYCDKLPELLVIDVEGLDYRLLKGLDLKKYPIPVICVEVIECSDHLTLNKNKKINDLLIQQDYVVFADTNSNQIYIRKKWMENLL